LENVADSFRPSVIKPHQSCDSTSRQQIFYGAPGTGKSHKKKEQLKGLQKKISLERHSIPIVIIQLLLEHTNLQKVNVLYMDCLVRKLSD
jgi:Cdc6-like AAA superfamily ATPase